MAEKSTRAYDAKERGPIASAKSVEIRCASAENKTATRTSTDAKSAVFARSSSVTAITEKVWRRTSSAPLQKRNAASASTRVQVNIVIDAPGLDGEATEKSLVCGKTQDGKDATEKNGEDLTKVRYCLLHELSEVEEIRFRTDVKINE